MKILITGGSGLLGQYLNRSLSEKNEILTLYYSNFGNCKSYNSIQVNLCEYSSLLKIFNDFNPDVVIHTAAISNTILSNGISPKDVYNINVNATKSIAELCDKFKSKLIYTSTDLVYAGYRGSKLKEDAKLIPLSLYAETKLMGEIKIQKTFDNFIILRTALLFGFGLNHSTNHFQKMFFDLKAKKEVKLFTDQFRTPISLIEAARIMSEIVQLDINSTVINFGGLERVSRYELGERLCEVAKLDKNLLIRIKMSDVPELPNVEDVSMNTEKLSALGIKRKTLNESIKEVIS
ncbi:MAG TPA: NAD(P)-dependent oxidoreductase [Ignavibacteriaceae bacterium]|nr:NAD(P)-dependent oxidoreductase [Ignavibacteriaceae bacterium]